MEPLMIALFDVSAGVIPPGCEGLYARGAPRGNPPGMSTCLPAKGRSTSDEESLSRKPRAIPGEGSLDGLGIEAEIVEAVAVDAVLVPGVRRQPAAGARLVFGAEVVSEVPAGVAHGLDRLGDEP